MKKGNIYKNDEGMVVLFLKTTDNTCFKGVVLYHPEMRDVIGIINKNFYSANFKEYVGDLTINNVMNER